MVEFVEEVTTAWTVVCLYDGGDGGDGLVAKDFVTEEPLD